MKSTTMRIMFTQDEDRYLSYLVSQHGENWDVVANFMASRNARQCRDRYKNYLSPNIYNGPWTAQEDDELINKFLQLGPKWSAIAKYFPGRTDVNIKNRFATIGKKKNLYNTNIGKNSRKHKEIELDKKKNIKHEPAIKKEEIKAEVKPKQVENDEHKENEKIKMKTDEIQRDDFCIFENWDENINMDEILSGICSTNDKQLMLW